MRTGNARLLRIALILSITALLISIFERVWAFGQYISSALSVLVGAWFLAFLVKSPIERLTNGVVPPRAIRWAEQRYGTATARRLSILRLPLSVAVTLVYGVVLLMLIGAVAFATATLIPQATDLVRRLPDFSITLQQEALNWWSNFALRFGLDPNALSQLLASQELSRQITQVAGSAASQVLTIAAGTATAISQLFLVIVLSLFIVLEDQKIKRQLFALLPPHTHEGTRSLLTAIDRAFNAYLRAQVIGAALRGLFILLVFSVFQINFGVVVAIAFALLSFIPIIGGPIGVAIVLIVALLVRPEMAWLATALALVFDQVVAYAVLPRLTANLVGVPGPIAIVALTIGVQLLGFWGLILSVPIVGAAYAVLFEFWLPRQTWYAPAAARPMVEGTPSAPTALASEPGAARSERSGEPRAAEAGGA